MSESVQSNSAVLVHFTLKLDDGTTAESTRNNGKPALFRLGDASLSEGLEQHLLGLKWAIKPPSRWSQMRRLACRHRT
ncbi:FkbB-type 16 kD peptidyl-prolyl cis-trans isomerase [Escherichia coli]|nr:FkbB-type 16 kD peptidyl-prolyl cis-trans isomerase [Escherichia coli]